MAPISLPGGPEGRLSVSFRNTMRWSTSGLTCWRPWPSSCGSGPLWRPRACRGPLPTRCPCSSTPRSLEAKSQELSALSTLLLTSLSSHHRWDSPPGRWLPALGDKLRGPEHKVPASAEGAGTANMKLTAAVTHLGTGTLPPWKSITSSTKGVGPVGQRPGLGDEGGGTLAWPPIWE